MNRENVLAALEAALTEVLERTVSGLTGEVRLFEDLHLDSTTMLEMLMALEESIGLQVDPEELDVDDFETVNTFVKYTMSTLSAGPPVPA